MAESNNAAYYETLQVHPTAEPEVLDAAYRALAKKYHPDRSTAPDAMARMARINAAFQAVRPRGGRISAGDSRGEPVTVSSFRLSQSRVDPNAPLEEILAQATQMVGTARQRVIDELTGDGVPHEVAASIVAAALRSLNPGSTDESRQRRRAADVRLDPTASYDDALQIVTQKAQAMRDLVADELVRSGLNRGAAVELTDAAFQRIRHSTLSPTAESRLSPDRVDLSGPLDSGLRVVSGKLRAARQLVVDELTRDGIPLRTAEQLVDEAGQSSTTRQRR